jgi:hypothetical protein
METIVERSQRSVNAEHGTVSPVKLSHFVLVTRDMARLRDWYDGAARQGRLPGSHPVLHYV